MQIFRALGTSASALTAERLHIDLIANNIANANTTRQPDGTPFRRQLPVFEAVRGADGIGEGVRVAAVVADPAPLVPRYDPGHPDADAQGYVQMPNVQVTAEMVDLIAASRAYEANVNAIEAARQLVLQALSIGR